MTSSDALFQLVKSLSKGEKRYVRLVAARYSGQKKYMLLFDEIDHCEDYNEVAIRERVDPGGDPKQFHVIKNYLLELILRSLRSYEARSSGKSQLRTLIANITILYNRGIFGQAQRLLKQATKLAEELDNPALTLEVIELRLRLGGKGKTKEDSGEEAQADRMKTVRELERRYRYLDLRARIEESLVASARMEPEEQRVFDLFLDDPLLTEPPHDASLAVYNLYYQALSLCHYGKGNDREALQCMMRLKEVYDADPARRSSYSSEYVILLGNMLQLTMRMEEYELHEELLRELRNFPQEELLADVVSPRRAKGIYLETLYSAQLHRYTRQGEFERCVALESEIETYLSRTPIYRHQSNRRHHRFLLAYAHFGLGNFGRALRLLNDIVNEKEPEQGRSLYYSARLLQIMAHYELENYNLVGSLERSLRNRLLDRNLIGSYEADILRFLRRAISLSAGTTGIRETAEAPFPHDHCAPRNTGVFQHLDFSAWAEAGSRKVPLSRFLQQRFNRAEKRG